MSIRGIDLISNLKDMHLFLKSNFTILGTLIVLMMLNSCGTRKEMVYLQPDSSNVNTIYEQYVPKIQPSDILTISVGATDPKVTAPFTPLAVNATGVPGQNFDLALRPTYTVDEEGYIQFPLLGRIKIGGLTRLEAIASIQKQLEPYIKNPNVNMNYNNFRVSILGEVSKPGSFVMPTERVTILEALGMAGDMTIRGVRSNVLLIREVNGQKTMHRLDLTKQETLNSPYYYMAQNDVLYVEPNKTQINNSKLGSNASIAISIAGLLITIISLVTR
ncbi:polysaccharide biosynthesis/export family protein [Sphingobacterium siyangense]|uniref:polysaccharide biosynthesis/export family protein n=1 Tax=Sphingobacterium siyangense TaxID=459529 RepID=UPI002FDD3D43